MYSSLILLGLFLSSLHARPILNSERSATRAFKSCAGICQKEKPLLNDEEEYGWLGVGKPLEYLESKPLLTTPIEVSELEHYVPNLTQEQNIARWALRQATAEQVARLALMGQSSEAFTALIWLIGIAEGKPQKWISRANKWANYRGKLPEGLERVASFNQNFENDYQWMANSRGKRFARPEDSDVTAMAIYLGSAFFSEGQEMPNEKHYYNIALIERKASLWSSFK
ncbi:uncharacterized protein MELLADRAFT_53986 [Melampsora larici-populina 98AG31]|uniref:Secreted protein n=1 Tax=Melampsora larici-populina (strain 98AG31 / pathotype 3-4-7) TaxID=747676 RepID=F4S745_MELLP|nr:uncharacterized protein MELLADRAFT_53986 [Melampsora larici-populina 98AG31]EGF99531.1 secreted protein [Melampsora larici-populina 98AG31]